LVTGPRLIGTGPYRVTSRTSGKQVVLERNPRFRAWFAPARPDGFPVRIVWKAVAPGSGITPGADLSTATLADLHRLALSAPDRIRRAPFPGLEFLILNTRTPPFDRLAARQALAWAIDRRPLLAAAQRAVPSLTAACQVIPPGTPGYAPYCPYTPHPSAGNAAALSHDLGRARRLVKRSGTAGMPVTFVTNARDAVWVAIGRRVVALLRRLGYRARLDARDPPRDRATWTEYLHQHAQIGVGMWIADLPLASAMVTPLLSCQALRDHTATNQAQFCDRRIDAAIDHAHTLESTDPARAVALWSRIDRALTRRARSGDRRFARAGCRVPGGSWRRGHMRKVGSAGAMVSSAHDRCALDGRCSAC
jgi:peptide/nickel transport system substrate-binding protein